MSRRTVIVSLAVVLVAVVALLLFHAANAHLRVAGTVRSASGAPIAGVAVFHQHTLAADPEPHGGTVTTDAEGMFALPVEAEDEEPFLLVFSAPGHATMSRWVVPQEFGTRLDVTLPDAGRIAGKVLAADGTPLAGARVGAAGAKMPPYLNHEPDWMMAAAEVTRTAADGTFVLDAQPLGEDVHIPASAPGFGVSVEGPVRVGSGDPVTITLHPETGARIGALFHEDGRRTLRNARMFFHCLDPEWRPEFRKHQRFMWIVEGQTDAFAQFDVRGLPSEMDRRLLVQVPEPDGVAWYGLDLQRHQLYPGELRVKELAEGEGVSFAGKLEALLPRDSAPASGTLGSIRGVLRDEAGVPVAGGVVKVRGRHFPYTLSDSQGAFELKGLLLGTHMLHAAGGPHAPRIGIAPEDAQPVAVPAGTVAAEVTLVLREYPSISGVVTDPEGNPVPGLTVRAEWGEGGPEQRSVTRSERHPSGAFLLPLLPEGATNVSISVFGDGYETSGTLSFPSIPEAPVTVPVLLRGGRA